MFRAHALVLNIQKIRDQQIRIILFSHEYGRIHCWSKKELSIDIGNLVEVYGERKWSENHIKSADTTGSINEYLQKYSETTRYLRLMENLGKILPEGVENPLLYNDIVNFIDFIRLQKNTYTWIFQLIILLHIRIFKKLGFLREELFWSSWVLIYIYENIDKKSIYDLWNSKELKESERISLENILQETYHHIIHWT